ncbi:MAG: FAD-binding oxidoreductase [Gammaproteobacteria bacterium]|nr:FAD-binding oxidoreductase [Pseudomonadales bacterium]MCP5346861.1 FAD-binding oxidoreductase [Pseudomonadales bacterium]
MNSTVLNSELKARLATILGPSGLVEGGQIESRNYRDWMGSRSERPALLLRPANTGEVSQLLQACHEFRQPITPQGGLTGLVSAAAPLQGELALSLERMKKIEEIDRFTSTMTVEAGVELQTIQEQAEAQGMLFPLDLGARGSCTIGGNLSTNAGGNRVIRYGMTRALTLGVEAVLADGTVINGLNKLRKNNSGYDLNQLFIGSEGTLGVITRAVLKLMPKPTSQTVAFCGVGSFDQVAELLLHCQQHLGGNLTAFEVLWDNTYQLIAQHLPEIHLPLPAQHEFYVLIEAMGSEPARDREHLDQTLSQALEAGLVSDCVIAESEKQNEGIWRVRDGAAEVIRGAGFMHAYDVSLAIGDMDHFAAEVAARLTRQWPDTVLGVFGHVGDGNIHLVVNVGPETRQAHGRIDSIIYQLIQELNGSISAEHGIGLMKKPFLGYSRSEAEIALMRRLKDSLDPRGILSPGRIF